MPELTETTPASRSGWNKALLAAAVALPLLLVFGNPIAAFVAGAVIGIVADSEPLVNVSKYGKLMLQAAIVLLAFRIDLGQLIAVSGNYVGWVAVYVLGTLGLGWGIARTLGHTSKTGTLISAGTAICGGTAIATVAPTIKARADQLAVALAIVFVLNGCAMLVFPLIGSALDMSQEAFGVWAALAVHDTSSVVGTAASYGDEALLVATTVKLTRTLWLIPLVFVLALAMRSEDKKIRVPGFVLLFIAAAVANSFVPLPISIVEVLQWIGGALMIGALFCVGLEFRRATFKMMRVKALGHALTLWLVVSGVTLTAVLAWI